ncbi:MAG: radical SAM protein [Deltaproteobacteria bacterium]|nr:radical SAM protein [Deltaproteobacteria bacterium]MBW2069229.1 radical SAM protein [Deltaproteobacteria bacterium]
MRKKRRRLIFPIFLPFAGCPYRCVYCNQYATTSSSDKKSFNNIVEYVRRIIDEYGKKVALSNCAPELAFFGGTFTCLPEGVLVEILKIAACHVEYGHFSGIRFSTRPDALDDDVLDLLKNFPIRTIEIGAQSLDDGVLSKARRGYGAETVVSAVKRIRAGRWNVGLQLMPGLPGETAEVFDASVETVCRLKPDFVRIYPTLVLKDTVLERWFREGKYRPLSLRNAIERSLRAVMAFEEHDIDVIRIGLQATPELDSGAVVAGPYHPAFGFLVRVHWWRCKLDRVFESSTIGDTCKVWIPARYLSEFLGPKSINVRYWKKRWKIKNFLVEKESSWLERRMLVSFI